MVAYLEPQATDQFNGVVFSNLLTFYILPVEVIKNLIQPPKTKADVGVLYVNGNPADPDGGQPFAECPSRILGDMMVDPCDLTKFFSAD